MIDFRQYETEDAEERSVTVALMELFDSIARSGATEDPLAVVCRCLVDCIPEVQFAFYCYAGEETGHIAAVKDGVKLLLPAPDVERKIVAQLRQMTAVEDVAVITPELALSLLSPKDRKRWKCHCCMAMRISDNDKRDAAVLSVYFPPDADIQPRHCGWMSLIASAASAYLARTREFVKVRSALAAAIGVQNEQSLALDAMRKRVREYLAEIAKVKAEYLAKNLSSREAVRAIENSAESLYALSDIVDRSRPDEKPSFRSPEFGAWVKKGMRDARIKAIVGIRGTNKSGMLHAVHKSLLTRGVAESRIVIIDFEDVRFRRFKTAADVVAYLKSFPASKQTRYLFLDEVGMVSWHEDLLKRLQKAQSWNVWLSTSSEHVIRMGGKDASEDILTYRVWSDPKYPRSRSELERIWCQIFMRDVVSGVDHPDIRAKEILAEYYSDHLGEIKSLQEISAEMSAFGRRLARSSISAYRQSLIDAHLIEISEVYDVFEKSVVTSISGRAFYTDLELRNWRYGIAPENDAPRQALNRFYLELRRKYDKVYTPRDKKADFVTIDEKGEAKLWTLPKDASPIPVQFREGGG